MDRQLAFHSDGTVHRDVSVMDYVPLPEAYYTQNNVTGAAPSIVNAMSVDVEDYYQVSAFDPYIKKEEWDSFPSRVEASTDRMLEMFSNASVKGTFFTLGCVAKRHPDIVKKICDEGHELASHGWMHYRVREQTQQQFGEDIRKTKSFLEDLTGQSVKGYRAASYSIDESTPWAHDELLEAGYQYSSSIVPVKHDHYGVPHAPRFPFNVNPSGMLEIPVSTYRLGKTNHPCGGGGWFRLYPYAVSRFALKHINDVEHRPSVFYIHPWEIDPGQPRQQGLDFRTRFRHYMNLKSAESKLNALLNDFQWGRMDDIYLKDSSVYASGHLSDTLKS
ncbi:MAG: XrtA system polysaccharide deacetylase [Granulosicoccus sp.]